MHCLAVRGVPLGWHVPSVVFLVDGDVVADSVGGVVVGSDDWAGCGLGSSGEMVGGVGGLVVRLLGFLGSDLLEYHGSLRCW